MKNTISEKLKNIVSSVCAGSCSVYQISKDLLCSRTSWSFVLWNSLHPTQGMWLFGFVFGGTEIVGFSCRLWGKCDVTDVKAESDHSILAVISWGNHVCSFKDGNSSTEGSKWDACSFMRWSGFLISHWKANLCGILPVQAESAASLGLLGVLSET